jgi:phage tail sheath gpL-like
VLPPPPSSGFIAGASSFNAATGEVTLTETVADPGTFSWLVTFQNGKFGVFASSNKKCKAGQVRLGGKCRPSKIVFAKGTKVVAAPGAVTFKLKPSASGLKALKNALKQKKGLPVTIMLTFQSARGGAPASQTKTMTVKLKKR